LLILVVVKLEVFSWIEQGQVGRDSPLSFCNLTIHPLTVSI
jgi:hypothetical protein